MEPRKLNIKKTLTRILCSVDRASLYDLVNKAKLVQNFSQYVYFFAVHVQGDYVPIIRSNNCVYATLGISYSVWMTDDTLHTRQSSIQNNKYQVRINTVVSPDDGHIVARNKQRKEINIIRKIVHQVGFIYKF